MFLSLPDWYRVCVSVPLYRAKITVMESDDFEEVTSGPNDPTFSTSESPVIMQLEDDARQQEGPVRPGAGNDVEMAELGLSERVDGLVRGCLHRPAVLKNCCL